MPTPAATALTTTEKKLIQDWLKDDVIAKDIICRHLSPTILQCIPQERSSTTHDAWKLLHSLFDHVNLSSQYLVREKIFGLQMKDAKDAQRYLGEHETLRRDLVRMGVAYTDSKAVFNLLKGLPCRQEKDLILSWRNFGDHMSCDKQYKSDTYRLTHDRLYH